LQAVEGFNELCSSQSRSVLKIAIEVIREPMFILLICAGGIYLAMGDAHEALILLGFVFVIMGVTIFQERRTEKAIEALRDLSSPRAVALRGGKPTRIAGSEVVRGDILFLSEGDRIPADGRVITSHELAVDESMLTGESVSIQKNTEPSGIVNLFAGTLIVCGQAVMEVAAIGSNTELGKIGKTIQTIESEISPLQKEIASLAKQLAVIGIGLCLLVLLLYIALRGSLLQGLLAGITLAMGILPQEFPVIMIIFMAFGAMRIAKHRVLTRRLSAIETLGKTTVLCVDKTGTLTQNKMAVSLLSVNNTLLDTAKIEELPEEFHELIEYCVLASEIKPHDPMEHAFHILAGQYLANTEHIHNDWDLVKEYEISPELLAMSHLWRIPEGKRSAVATKGAPEAITDLCHLDEAKKRAVLQQAVLMANTGLRVIGVAKALYSGSELPKIQHDFEFKFLGLVGLADPIRDEVPSAIEECQRAGIRVVMITGDHPKTAMAIASKSGIRHATTMTGLEIDSLDKDLLASKVKDVNIFARVTSRQKLLIVEALKTNGEIVAMTGDGVNDAPALKSAHIGIAMGKRGTDVAREAASLVLLEDDFNAIVEAIRLGRRIFTNLRRAMTYTLAVHIPMIGLSILPLLFGLPLILAPIHIAFLELIINPACSVVFEAEKADMYIMQKPPRSPSEKLFTPMQLLLSILQGSAASIVIVGFYWLLLTFGVETTTAKAMAFVVLVVANVVLIFSVRSHLSSYSIKTFTEINMVGLTVILITLLSLVFIVSIPFIANFFAFSSLGLIKLVIAFGIGVGMFYLFETIDFFHTRLYK